MPDDLTISAGDEPGLFDVRCGTCGRAEVMEGDQPVVQQLAVFHLLHGACLALRAYAWVPAARVPSA